MPINFVRHASASVNFRTVTLLNVAWAIVIVMLLALALNLFIELPGRDSSAFMYVGGGILEGDLPYLDRWDHKGPLLYVVNLLGLMISNVWGIWLVEMIFLMGWVWIAFTLSKDNFGLVPALFSLAVLLSYFVLIDTANSPGTYALTLKFISLYLFVRVERGEGGPWFAMAIGALSACTFFLLPSLIGLYIAIGLYWIIRKEKALDRILLAIAGALPVVLIVFGVFAAVGGLYAMWDAVIVYNFAYTNVPFTEKLGSVLGESLRKSFLLLPLIGAWCIGLCYFSFVKRWRQERFAGMLKLGLILLPIEIVLISLSGRGYIQYYLSLLPVAMILMSFIALSIYRTVGRLNWMPCNAPSFALLLGITFFGSASMYFFTVAGAGYLMKIPEKYMREGGVMHGDHLRVVNLIRKETDPHDTILVYGGGETSTISRYI